MKFLYEWDEENKQPASEQLKAQTKPKKNDIIQAMVKAGIPLDVTSDSDSEKENVKMTSPTTTIESLEVEPVMRHTESMEATAPTSNTEATDP